MLEKFEHDWHNKKYEFYYFISQYTLSQVIKRYIIMENKALSFSLGDWQSDIGQMRKIK